MPDLDSRGCRLGGSSDPPSPSPESPNAIVTCRMDQPLAPVEIPRKPAFKPSEVCDLLNIPSYVLRTWENEFKDLGVAKAQGGARSYRRQDVQLAVRIKELVFAEHLTLAGVRRRLEQ